MPGTIVALTGPIAVGKHQLAERLIRCYGFEPIIRHTTAKPRWDEATRLMYNHLDQESFREISKNDALVYKRVDTFDRTRQSGVLRTDVFGVTDRPRVMIVDAGAAYDLYQFHQSTLVVYLESPFVVRKDRSIKRGDNSNDFLRSNRTDAADFNSLNRLTGYHMRLQNEYFRIHVNAQNIASMVNGSGVGHAWIQPPLFTETVAH